MKTLPALLQESKSSVRTWLATGRNGESSGAAGARILAVGGPEAEASARSMFPGSEMVALVRETALAEYMVFTVKPDVVVVGEGAIPRGETVEQWVARLNSSLPGLQVIVLGAKGVPRERGDVPRTQERGTRVIGQETITVWSPKGGVGKTFVAVNLACASAMSSGGNTCLVDFDLQSGDVACYLDLLEGPSIIDVLSNLSDTRPETVEKYVEIHPPTGLRVLSAPKRPELSDLVKPHHIREVLSLARRRWGLVFVDTCPDITSEVVGECIEQATKVVMVVTQDVAALRQAKIALDILRRVGLNRNESLFVVVNRVSNQSLFPVSRIEEYLEVEVAGTIPEDRKAVERAGMDGKPVVLYSRTDAGEAFSSILNRLVPGLAGAGAPGRRRKRRFGFW